LAGLGGKAVDRPGDDDPASFIGLPNGEPTTNNPFFCGISIFPKTSHQGGSTMKAGIVLSRYFVQDVKIVEDGRSSVLSKFDGRLEHLLGDWTKENPIFMLRGYPKRLKGSIRASSAARSPPAHI
jgi:hypothetical protein